MPNQTINDIACYFAIHSLLFKSTLLAFLSMNHSLIIERMDKKSGTHHYNFLKLPHTINASSSLVKGGCYA